MSPAPLATLFLEPKLLLAALAATALVLAAAFVVRRRAARRRDGLLAPAMAEKAGLPRPGWAVPAALVALVALGTGLALARPRWGEVTEEVERKGADVAVLLDTSASMRATDVSPSRFVLAQKAAASLLGKLGGDRIALVGVEGEAQVLVPLTLDSAAAGLFLDALEPGIGARPGTSLASGLLTASELFPPGAPGTKHAVVISDGEDLEGGVDEAIAKAKQEGITVHTVFVGAVAGRGAPVPEVDLSGRQTGFKTGEGGSPVLSRPDPELLRKLAAATGGSFSVVSPGRTDLDGVARAIDLAAKRPLSGTVATNRQERFQIPLGLAVAAAGLLLLGPLRRPGAAAAALALALLATAPAALAQTTAPVQPLAANAGNPAGQAARPAPEAASGAAPQRRGLLDRAPFVTAHGEAKAGVKAFEEKRADEGLARFRREAELAPDDLTGAYNVGSALSRTGQADEALATLESVLKSKAPKDLRGAAAFNAGTTLYRAGKYDGAATAFREAVKLAPGDPDAAWNYELSLRRAEEERKKSQQQSKDQEQKGGPKGQQKDQKDQGQDEKEKAEKDFQEKAKMSREKADQLLSAINRADLDEQRKRMAEQKAKRHVARDW